MRWLCLSKSAVYYVVKFEDIVLSLMQHNLEALTVVITFSFPLTFVWNSRRGRICWFVLCVFVWTLSPLCRLWGQELWLIRWRPYCRWLRWPGYYNKCVCLCFSCRQGTYEWVLSKTPLHKSPWRQYYCSSKMFTKDTTKFVHERFNGLLQRAKLRSHWFWYAASIWATRCFVFAMALPLLVWQCQMLATYALI